MLSSMRFPPCHMEQVLGKRPQSSIFMVVQIGTAVHEEEEEPAARCTLSDILSFGTCCVCAKPSRLVIEFCS